MIVAVMGSFLPPFMGGSINVALPSIGEELSIDAVTLNWVATSYLLAAAMFLVPFGRLADIYGRKRFFTAGMIVYAISSFLCALSFSTISLIIFRVLQGIGSAMVFGTGIAIVTSVFPVGERGKALGINVASVYIGLSLGPFLGGILTEQLSWRSIFLINVPLSMAALVPIFWKLKSEWAEAKGEKFDLTGSLVYSLALIAVMYGLSLLPEMAGVWLLVAGVLGAYAFIMIEMKVRSPVLNMALFKANPVFLFSNLAALCNYSATFAVSFLLSLYLQYIKGFSPLHAGIILVSQPVVMAIISPLSGRLSDRIEPRLVASAGMALTTTGLALLIFLNEDTGMAFILVSLIILGLGFGLFSSPNTNAIMSSVEKKFYGVASGTVGTMRLIGQMLSMGIAILLFALYLGRTQIIPAYYPEFMESVRMAFIIFAVLCFGGVFASIARGKMR